MQTPYHTFLSNGNIRKTLSAAATAALFVTATHVFADPPLTMAPPTDQSFSQTADGLPSDSAVASQDSVFNWKEVPTSQNVPIRRAIFDRGGYQLYDTAGETIVVPFTNNNLYVMKFGLSEDGTTYFVNDGDAPVLYVPRNGYLENASVPGARWFPFPEDFQPEQPVFLGIAPSWDDYCEMGWYPHMVFYGGYWGYHPFFAGSLFTPSFGLSIFIGGHHYDGWEPYRHYYAYHPAPFHVTIVNRNVYHFGGGYGGGHEYFRGTGHPYAVNHDFGGDRRFGSSHFSGARESGVPHDFNGGRTSGGGHVFNGAGQPYYAHRTIAGDRDFNGFRGTAPSGGRTFGGGQAFSGSHSLSGTHTFQGTRPEYTGNFGQSPSGGGHSFNGGGRFDGPRAVSQGGHSYAGGQPAAGGNGRPSGGHDDRGGGHGDDHGGGHGDDHGGGHGDDHGGHR